jgi:hypothetical protein
MQSYTNTTAFPSTGKQEPDETYVQAPEGTMITQTEDHSVAATPLPIGSVDVAAYGAHQQGNPMPFLQPVGGPLPALSFRTASPTGSSQPPVTALAASSSSTGRHDWSPAVGSAIETAHDLQQVSLCQ